jgi:hypothetical protein
VQGGVEGVAGVVGEAAPPSTTDEPTGVVTTTGESTTGSESTTGEFVCDPNMVADTLAFTYVKKFDTGIPDKILQASYYNTVADEVMIMSFNGQARRFTVDGTAIGEVFMVPAEALPSSTGRRSTRCSSAGCSSTRTACWSRWSRRRWR